MKELTEAQEQATLVKWLTMKGWLFTATAQATPAGHIVAGRWKPSYLTLAKNRALGVRKGFPDLCVVTGRGKVVFIEMKRASGVHSDVSPEQRQWLSAMVDDRMSCAVCCGFKEAKGLLEAIESGSSWTGRVSSWCHSFL